MSKISLALISNDIVGTKMAGPGIRSTEMARVLSGDFDVTLFVPDDCDLENEPFKIQKYDSKSPSTSIGRQLRGVDYILAQSLRPVLLRKVKALGIKFIADLYDPLTIETLEYTRLDKLRVRANTFAFNYDSLALQLAFADHILCASEVQKDFYLGILADRKIINPRSYERSPNFDNLISLAPFGLNDKVPEPDKDILFEKFPEIKRSDKIVYWGGGIWDWFDPLSVVAAIEIIASKRDDVKLLFLGTKHPNPKIKEMSMAAQTLEYASGHDLLDKKVFFNTGWMPYTERINFLGHAAIGISTHNNNLETRFSFRTRILDYLWAKVPIVATVGDAFASLVENKKLGLTVEYNNAEAIATAILKLVDDKEFYAECQRNLETERNNFFWPSICAEFSHKIRQGKIEARPFHLCQFLKLTFYFYYSGLKKKLFK